MRLMYFRQSSFVAPSLRNCITLQKIARRRRPGGSAFTRPSLGDFQDKPDGLKVWPTFNRWGRCFIALA